MLDLVELDRGARACPNEVVAGVGIEAAPGKRRPDLGRRGGVGDDTPDEDGLRVFLLAREAQLGAAVPVGGGEHGEIDPANLELEELPQQRVARLHVGGERGGE
jgi:hypothetical protein